MSRDIKLKTKFFDVVIPLKAISIVIIILLLFLFPIYMENYPSFQNSVMGNESLPTPLKHFIVISPTVVYIVLSTFLLIYLSFSLYFDIIERWRKRK